MLCGFLAGCQEYAEETTTHDGSGDGPPVGLLLDRRRRSGGSGRCLLLLHGLDLDLDTRDRAGLLGQLLLQLLKLGGVDVLVHGELPGRIGDVHAHVAGVDGRLLLVVDEAAAGVAVLDVVAEPTSCLTLRLVLFLVLHIQSVKN